MRKAPEQRFDKKLIDAVFQAVRLVFEEGVYADKAIETVFKANKNWKSFQRRYVSETVYGMIRWWRLLLVASDEDGKELSEKLLYKMLSVYYVLNNQEVPELEKFKNVPYDKIKQRLKKYTQVRKLRESVPDWLDETGEKELGKRWDSVINALNSKPLLYIRANGLKTSPLELLELFEKEGIGTALVHTAPSALRVDHYRNLFRSPLFKEGMFEIQDAASQAVSDFLQVRPGMRVIDACAGAGGKTLHIASIMGNKGTIIAMDTEERKLEELRKRASRASAKNIETRVITSTKVVKRLKDSADRLLLDVPCTGSGVLRRNPDAKWRLSPEEMQRIQVLQKDILWKYQQMVKPGGMMVYATCSIFPSEGELQVKDFLDNNPGWKLKAEKRLWPDTDNCDGFYMALLEKPV